MAQTHGVIDGEVACEALELFAEHVINTRDDPGKHPNIDRLCEVEKGGRCFSVRCARA